MTRRLLVLATALLIGCDRGRAAAPSTRPTVKTIASTVPAVTDLVVGMGATDRLVAVSTYDRNRPDVGKLPKAGDYQTADWETLAALHPAVLATAIRPDRQPAGYRQQADALHIRLINVQVDQLDDLAPAITEIGDALDEPALAAVANRTIHDRLDAIKARVAGLPPVSALIVYGPDATAVAGPGTYLDDLLHLAGGTNAAASLGTQWPDVDAELIASLHPAVVLYLLPDATPQQRAAADALWARRKPVRVCPIYDSYALLPGWHLPAVAERFAQCLHPSPATAP